MKILLDGIVAEGVDFTVKDKNGRTALHIAVERKLVHIAGQLMENEVPCEEKDLSGKMPVEIALENKDDEMAALIIKNMTQAT